MTEDIPPEELKFRLEKGEKINLFDVREEWEYEEANIGGKLMPLPLIPMKIDMISQLHDQEIVLHCSSGKRSHQAKKFLNNNGFRKVRCLIGGMKAYLNE